MTIYLEINNENGLVVNAINFSEENNYTPEPGYSLVVWDEEVRPWIGWTYNSDGSWEAPPEPEIIDEEV